MSHSPCSISVEKQVTQLYPSVNLIKLSCNYFNYVSTLKICVGVIWGGSFHPQI